MDIHERVILLDLKIQLAEDEKCLSVLKILKVGIPQDIGQPDHMFTRLIIQKFSPPAV